MSNTWSWTAGGRGCTARVMEETRGGVVVLKCTAADGNGYERESLGFTVRDPEGDLDPDAVQAAKAEATKLSNLLARGGRPRSTLTVGELIDRYRAEELTRKSEARQKRLDTELTGLRRYLGEQRPVTDIDATDWTGWVEARTGGKLDAKARSVDTDGVSPRTAGKHLATLRMLCQWARTVKEQGERLLEADPTEGLTLPSNDDPAQPIYTDAEYEALLEASDEPLRALLLLFGETGRRIGAVVRLKWSDWYPDQELFGQLEWRADADKVNKRWTAPVNERVHGALERRRRAGLADEGAMSDWIFPAPRDQNKHLRADVARTWLIDAEDDTDGVEHVAGRGFHGLRRRWVTIRKGKPRADLAAAGGWKDPQTLAIYEQADRDAVRDVVLNPEHELRAAEG